MKTIFYLIGIIILIISNGCKKSSSPSDVNLNNGLIAYYPFNGNANDESANKLNGTIAGGVSFSSDVSGKANSAVTFDGSTGYILVPDPTNKFQTSQVSISILINLRNASVRNEFVSSINFNDASGVNYGLGISQAGTNKYQFGVESNINGCSSPVYDPSINITASNNIITNQWHSVIAIFSDSLQSLYVDGILNSAVTRNFATLNQCSSNQDLVIGGWWSGDLVSVAGSLDELRIYNRVLNQNEILQLASAVK